ncbi:hypothetical protein RYZ26_10700 [Terasakiella sp. A23]|uniref:hypothetical protein n=1 Tax=Terasakiella sp. FCG-A23 TaxID=3080561 RepID=UPI0029549472|nr:hypothetical protein [Terasakiella sp. A23]MDV7340063.1 hypothetical protein [Terasakiella sp. A23]
MFEFKHPLISLLAFLMLWGISSENAQAIDVSKPLPKLPAKELLAGNSSHFHRDFDKGIHGDCTSLNARLQKALKDPEDEYAARVVLGEMYDREICVPYDPAKAYEHFKRAADMGGPYYYAIVAWKHSLGHGATHSEELTNEFFRYFLVNAITQNDMNPAIRTHRHLRDRQITPLLKHGIHWYEEILTNREKHYLLAKSLLTGNGVKYIDGRQIKQSLFAADRHLISLSKQDKNIAYFHSNELIKGTFGNNRKGEGQFSLINLAECGHVPSMIKLGEVFSSNDPDLAHSNREAYGWLLMAQRSGADVSNQLKKAYENAGSYLQITVPFDERFMPNLMNCNEEN